MNLQDQLYNYRLPGPVAPPSPPEEEKLLPPNSKTQNVHANPSSPYFYSTASGISAAHPNPPTYRSPHNGYNDFESIYPTNGSTYSTQAPYESQTTLSSLFSSAYKKALEFASNPSHVLPSHNKNPSNDLPSTYGNSSPTASTSALLRIPNAEALRYAGLCALWYASSALSSNTGKSIMARFRYPVTLTLIQFGFVAGYCVLFCLVREKLHELNAGNIASHRNWGKDSRRRSSISDLNWSLLDGLSAWGIKKPSKQALHGTLVMSFFQIAGHVFSSMAIARVPVSTVHTIKALSPLFTVLSYALLFRVRYSPATYISLAPLTAGVMLACSFDLRANAAGLICALGSTIIFVSQNIFSKKLLPKESSDNSGASTMVRSSSQGSSAGRLDKVNLLLYSSGMAFLLMIPIWLYTDFPVLLTPKPLAPDAVSRPVLFGLFLINGSVHFSQCLLAFSILARSSPVAYSIASLIKRIAVICLAIVWFGQTIRFVQAFGMAMTFFGLYLYNQSKSDVAKGERKRVVVEKQNQLLLPTTSSEARLLNPSSFANEITPSVTPLPYGVSGRSKTPNPMPPPVSQYRGKESSWQPAGEGNETVRLRNPSISAAAGQAGLTPPMASGTTQGQSS